MGLLDYFDPDTLRGKLKGLLGGMPISQMAQGRADFSGGGLKDALMGMPVFHNAPEASQTAYDAALNIGPMGMGTILRPKPFNVFHGTSAQFDEFGSGFGRTAKQIFTTPQIDDAAKYGSRVVKAEATPRKMIDFSDYEKLDKKTISAIKRAAKDSGAIDKYYGLDEFMGDLMDGQLYQKHGGQSMQNGFLDELLSRYDAVVMPDARVGGGVSTSVVFKDPKFLKVIK